MEKRFEKLDPKAQQRLLYALFGDRTAADKDVGNRDWATTFDVEFAKFCERHPEWKDDPSAWLFWKQPPFNTISDFLVIRRQLSGLCYMHAPTVLQHYKVVGCTQKTDHKMINVGEYVRTKLEGDAFAEHLTRNAGGSSTQFLDTITKGAATNSFKLPKDPPSLRHATADGVAKYLTQRGPGLVAHFHVDDTFGTTKRDSFLDDQVGPSRGMHAMVVIGYRKRGDDFVFLFQNWWKGCYFVEVSENYLAQAQADCVFITTELKEIPDDLPTVDTPYAETEADVGERYEFEGCL